MGKSKKTQITIDPRIFISPPFKMCPKCNKNEFGVLGIGVGYTRRCRECWHTQGFELPSLNKKIIYLDQFLISNMMKAIKPGVKARTGTDLPYYRELFEKLDRLMKLQLILCPSSSTHRLESLTATDYAALKRMSEHLSHNTSFYSNETIQRFQVISDFKQWLGMGGREIDVNRITYGRLDEWHDRFYISVDMFKDDVDLVDKIRAEREQASEALLPVFQRWQSETGKHFNDWVSEEQTAVGKSYWQLFVRRMELAERGYKGLSYEEVMPSEKEMILPELLKILREQGIETSDRVNKVNEYFSTQVKNVPHIHISTLLYASMAREASLGRKKPYNRGTLNDVDFVSTLAPYCDAMFIDNELQTRISSEPLKSRLGLSDRIYSLNKKNDFMTYLEGIESEMSDKHLELVNEVYGDWYNKPYTEMFQGSS